MMIDALDKEVEEEKLKVDLRKEQQAVSAEARAPNSPCLVMEVGWILLEAHNNDHH